MKKTLSVLLALVMIVAAISGLAMAAPAESANPNQAAVKVVAGGATTYYDALNSDVAALVANTAGGGTITLLKDITLAAKVTFPVMSTSNPVVLDLNGYTLTNNAATTAIVLNGNAVFTLKNGMLKQTGANNAIMASETTGGNNDGAGNYYKATVNFENAYVINTNTADTATVLDSKLRFVDFNITNSVIWATHANFRATFNLENHVWSTVNVSGSVVGNGSTDANRIFRISQDSAATDTKNLDVTATNSVLVSGDGTIGSGTRNKVNGYQWGAVDTTLDALVNNGGATAVTGFSFTAPDGTTLASPKAAAFGTAPTALTIPYTVTYDANGGEGTAPATVNGTVGTATTVAAGDGLTNGELQFNGWNTAADGTGTAYAAGATFAGGNVTLYAQWKDNKYTVSYNANGGAGTMEAQRTEIGSETTIAANTFTYEGFTFVGWNTAADNSGTAYAPGDKVSAETTLYAQWEPALPATCELADATVMGKVGANYYYFADFNDEIAAWAANTPGGATLYLLKDLSLTKAVVFPVMKTANPVVIDLCGNTLTSPLTYGIAVNGNAVLTIKNGIYVETGAGYNVAVATSSAARMDAQGNYYAATLNFENLCLLNTNAADGATVVESKYTRVDFNVTNSIIWAAHENFRATFNMENHVWTTLTANNSVIGGANDNRVFRIAQHANTAGQIAFNLEIVPTNSSFVSGDGSIGLGTRIKVNGFQWGAYDASLANMVESAGATAVSSFSTKAFDGTTDLANDKAAQFGTAPAPAMKGNVITVSASGAITVTEVPAAGWTATASDVTATAKQYAGWNTRVDGLGTNYKAGDTVPAGTVLYPCAIDMPQYTVTYKTGYAANDTIYTITDITGTAVAVPEAPSRNGYTFNGWDATAVDTIGTENVTLTATWTANSYTVTFDANGGEGSVPADIAAIYDVEFDLPAAPFTKNGYTFNGWNTAADGTGFSYADAATVKNVATTGTVTLYAQWNKKAVFIPEANVHACTSKCGVCGGCLDAACTEATCAKKCVDVKIAFADVSAADWFVEPVKYVYHAGLMKGVSETSFAPQAATSRAMIVTVLYRLAGEPEAVLALPFTDVDANGYYYNALKWAYGAGIINGKTETTFAPNADVTRQELATMLYRYAKYMGEDVTVAEDAVLSYTDAASVSAYAEDAILWATANGIVNGKGNDVLDPTGNAKRCEFAKMLMAYVEG